jgi:hypothetical protein
MGAEQVTRLTTAARPSSAIYFYFLAYVLSHGMGGEKSRTMVCLKTEQFDPLFLVLK